MHSWYLSAEGQGGVLGNLPGRQLGQGRLCCMYTCIMSLTAEVCLICSWCMKICLRRAARISTERLISVQTDKQMEIDMETNMVENMGDKSVYIRAFWP